MSPAGMINGCAFFTYCCRWVVIDLRRDEKDLLRRKVHNSGKDKVVTSYIELHRSLSLLLQAPRLSPLHPSSKNTLLCRSRTRHEQLGSNPPPSKGTKSQENGSSLVGEKSQDGEEGKRE